MSRGKAHPYTADALHAMRKWIEWNDGIPQGKTYERALVVESRLVTYLSLGMRLVDGQMVPSDASTPQGGEAHAAGVPLGDGRGYRRKPELDAALMALPGGIGKAIGYVRAAPIMEAAIRDCLLDQQLPEEITEPMRVAIDLIDGGDGVIYR
jgi:hypothetical protein